jgi:hypothetical protein
VRDAGFEPAAKRIHYEGASAQSSQIASQKRGLAEIVAIWADLPGALQAGVLAIVRSHRETCPLPCAGRRRPVAASPDKGPPAALSGRETGCGQVGRISKQLRPKHSASSKKRRNQKGKK